MRYHQGELCIGLADRGESCYVAKGPSTNHPKRGGRQAPLMQERSSLLGDPPAYPKSTKGNKNEESGKGKAKQKQKNRERRFTSEKHRNGESRRFFCMSHATEAQGRITNAVFVVGARERTHGAYL